MRSPSARLFTTFVAAAMLPALACKKPATDAATDAATSAAARVAPDPASSDSSGSSGAPLPSDAGSHIRPGDDADRSKPPPGAVAPPPLPLASDALELVAIGTSTASRVLWLQTLGSRVWLSARNLDAFAEADGALRKGPDILAKFPYKPGEHSMQVVGAYPKLFGLRTKNVNGRLESPEPTLFVYKAEDGGPGTWTQGKPLGMSWYPHAFVAYREGALVVTSQIQLNSAPGYYPPTPGTSLTYLAPDGTLSDPKLDVHPHFMAWGAAAEGSTLTLIGTVAIPPPKHLKDEGFGASGANLLRITPDGAKRVPLQTSIGMALETYHSKVHEMGGRAIAVPPASLTASEGWKPNGLTVFLVDGDKPRARTIGGNDMCTVVDAHHAGDVVYAVRRCYGEAMFEDVVRVNADGKTEKLALPRLVKKAGGGFRAASTDAEKKSGSPCSPLSLVVRAPDDVWVTASCGGDQSSSGAGGISVVLRRGRPQEPVVLP